MYGQWTPNQNGLSSSYIPATFLFLAVAHLNSKFQNLLSDPSKCVLRAARFSLAKKMSCL